MTAELSIAHVEAATQLTLKLLDKVVIQTTTTPEKWAEAAADLYQKIWLAIDQAATKRPGRQT